MEGRWCTLTVEAIATNAIDYDKEVSPLHEELVFKFLEQRRLETLVSVPQLRITSNDRASQNMMNARRAIMDGILPWLETDSKKIAENATTKRMLKWMNIYGKDLMKSKSQ